MREEEAPSPALNTPEEEEAAPPTKRFRHRVLACATLASIINAFMFMNFSPIVELSRRRFRATEGQVSWLYSAALLATLPCFFAGATRMSNADTQRGAVLAIHVLNAVAALLRLAAVARASYAAAVASSLALGAGTSLVVASYAAVPLLWLPQQERAAGVAWLVQGNYAGWALGAAATPAVVVDGHSFGRFVFLQALACVVMVPVAQLLLPGSAATREPLLDAGPPVARATLGKTIADLARRPRWIVACLSYAVAAGVGFAVPAVVDDIFGDVCGAAPRRAARVGVVFILAGVGCGALLGRFPCEKRRRPLLVALLAVGALALGGLHAATARPPCRPLDAFGGAAVAGAAAIGFVGPALAEAAASAGPDSTVMAGGIVEWWIQVLGAVVTQAATRRNGFAVCACAQAVAAVLLAGVLLCRRPPEE
jgi:MFS family permease